MPLFFLGLSCFLGVQTPQLKPVTVADFERFINATQYITDAERYGWSIVQQDVYRYTTVWGAYWCQPDGEKPQASENLPVTQVSYADAEAYCQWAGVRLPTYSEYWRWVKMDSRPIQSDNKGPIVPVDRVNIVGNVWDITQPEEKNAPIRLAGGSVFCSPMTCHGTVSDRELYVDAQTANIHIGFSVVLNP